MSPPEPDRLTLVAFSTYEPAIPTAPMSLSWNSVAAGVPIGVGVAGTGVFVGVRVGVARGPPSVLVGAATGVFVGVGTGAIGVINTLSNVAVESAETL